MKQQTRFYVSRKNPLTWIAAALSLASIVLQILALCLGEGAVISTVNIWFQKVLPMAVSLGFALQLVLEGETRFYRTSKPIFWACVYFGQAALDLHLHGGYALFGYMRYVVMCWILYLLLYLIYRLTITGKIPVSYPLLFTLLVPLAILIYDLAMAGCTIPVWYRLVKISNIAMAGSAVVAVLAMRPFTDGAYHPTWGDRKDGRLIRTLSPMNIVAGYIMPTRNDACNSIQTTFEISKVERYIRQKRAEGMESFGLTHVLLAAYVRCIAKYPGVNRFFSGQRVYQRDDDVQFTMTIKKDMRTDGEETTIKLHLTPTDTTKEVYEKLNALIDEVKNTPLNSSFRPCRGSAGQYAAPPAEVCCLVPEDAGLLRHAAGVPDGPQPLPWHGHLHVHGLAWLRPSSTTSITSATFPSSSPLAASTARSSSICRASPSRAAMSTSS